MSLDTVILPAVSVPIGATIDTGDSVTTDDAESDQPVLRAQIMKIQRNTKLSAKEKQQHIFKLFNRNKSSSSSSSNTDDKDSDEDGDEDKGSGASHCSESCSHPGNQGESTDTRSAIKNMLHNLPVSQDHFVLSHGGARIRIPCSQLNPAFVAESESQCIHYQRKCSMYAECCKKFYPCRLCHDNDNPDHTLDRKKVKVIRCRECHLIQMAGDRCRNSNCNVLFAEYHCDVCNLWSDPVCNSNEEVQQQQIYHCDKCDVCLIGRHGIDSEHCDTCGYCMPMERFKSHKCRPVQTDEVCSICLERFETPGHIEETACGHIFHKNCMERYIQHDARCPVCKRSLLEDLSRVWSMMDEFRDEELIPEEYMDWRVRYLCNDCHTMSESYFSFVGNKCHSCGGYNTSQDTIIKGDDGYEEEEEEEH